MSGSPLGPRPIPHPALLSPTSPTSSLQPESFLYLLHSDSGRPLFFEYLRNSCTEHHLLFWEQVQHYKRSHQPQPPNAAVRSVSEPPIQTPLEKASSIHKRFIMAGSPLQINITEQARTRIQSALSQCDPTHQPPPALFDESETVCVELMKGNYFYSFKAERDYTEWLATEKKKSGHGKKVKNVVLHPTKRKQHRLCVIL